jgi:hypothetical protein
MSYRELVGRGYVSRAFDESAFKFCITRNPYDRAVSLFHYLLQKRRIPGETSFLEFCRLLYETSCEPIGLFNTRGLSQCNPQVRWIEGIDLDFRGEFESLEADLKEIAALVGLDPVDVAHLNATPHKQYREYYCEESRDIIRDFYWEDFLAFDYKVDEV